LRLRTMGVGITEVKSEVLKIYFQAGSYAFLTIVYFYIYLYVRKIRK